ncbi:hypothetical protein [Streptomyces malaysiensis]|uniref:hypothetical protein n=1 Tax=Streptomyces malaysiensis TaxID=92644 RepID=UPI001E5A2518|nr:MULTISPECIES: hypothetical protein [unclassified Streptomyces]
MDQGTHQDPYDTSALRPVLPARSARSRTPGATAFPRHSRRRSTAMATARHTNGTAHSIPSNVSTRSAASRSIGCAAA